MMAVIKNRNVYKKRRIAKITGPKNQPSKNKLKKNKSEESWKKKVVMSPAEDLTFLF